MIERKLQVNGVIPAILCIIMNNTGMLCMKISFMYKLSNRPFNN